MNGLLRLLAIMRKEIRQLRRDRLTFGMIVGIPLLQITLFGFAINTDIRHIRAAVADASGTQLSRFLAADAEASQVVDIVGHARTAEELEEWLRRGAISVGILIPPDFGQRLQGTGRPAAQLLIDGSDPLILGAARQLAGMTLGYATALPPRIEPPLFEIRAYYNPERRSAAYIVPGLIGVILTMTMVLFTAVAIVRERERGNLELLINTPVRNLELMLGKIIPYVLITYQFSGRLSAPRELRLLKRWEL
jgi:ABC-2 type transport system permease protein